MLDPRSAADEILFGLRMPRRDEPAPRVEIFVPMPDVICAAIGNCELLEFDYDARHRVVAPYCHGFTARGEVLRAIQVGGDGHSAGTSFGKLWSVEKMRNLRRTAQTFTPNDPHYNPNDSAMKSIHCNVRR